MIDVERHSCIIRPIEFSLDACANCRLTPLLVYPTACLDIGSQLMAHAVLCLTFSRIDSRHCVFD